MHLGKLNTDAPGLAQNLKRYLKPEEVEQVSLAYELSCQYGALNEDKIVRDKSMSFNPRPARVAQILMTELRCCDPLILSCAMLGCARVEDLETLPSKFSHLQETFSSLKNIITLVSPPAPSAAVESALFAIVLDRTRHLHMIKSNPDSLKSEIKQIESWLLHPEKFEENSRLKKMIQVALSKLLKIIDINE